MTELERLDARIDADPPKMLFFTQDRFDEILRLDVARWRETGNPQGYVLGYTNPDGKLYYRDIPVKIVGTGLLE